MEGIEGEADQIFRYLGLNPEDLSIPVAAWEARKSLSPRSEVRSARIGDRANLGDDFGDRVRVRVGDGEVEDDAQVSVGALIGSGGRGIRPSRSAPPAAIRRSVEENVAAMMKDGNCEAEDVTELVLDNDEVRADETSENRVSLGIRGCRPPNLAPPPVVMRSVVDHTSSTWDIFRGFGPQDNQEPESLGDAISHHPIREVEESEEVGRRNIRQEVSEDARENGRGVGLDSCSDSSSDERGSSSIGLISENNHTISPSGSLTSFRSNITSWQKGDFLGSGSFGTVYEGFTE